MSDNQDKLRFRIKYGEKNSMTGKTKLPKGIRLETLSSHRERAHTPSSTMTESLNRRAAEKERAGKHPRNTTAVSLDKFGFELPPVAPDAKAPSVPSGHVGKWEVYRGGKKEVKDDADI